MCKNFISELLGRANYNNDWDVILSAVTKVREWNVLKCICMKKPRLTVENFKTVISLYRIAKQMKDSPAVVDYIEDMVFNYEVTPYNVKSADDVRVWNEQLKAFYVISGEAASADDENVDEFVLLWWQASCRKHTRIPNVFKLINETAVFDENFKSNWKGVFGAEELLKHCYFEQLLKCGEVEMLLEADKSNFVIENIVMMRSANVQNNRNLRMHYARMVRVKEMKKYLGTEKSNLYFFSLHPKGLETLVNNDCTGAVAYLADDFKENCRNYPSGFSEVVSKKDYTLLLNRALDI